MPPPPLACPACGHPRRASTRFCGRCGTDCGAPAPVDTAGPAPPAPGDHALVGELMQRATGCAGMTARLLATQVEVAADGQASHLVCAVEITNGGPEDWQWLEVAAFLLTAEGLPVADYRATLEAPLPAGERVCSQARFAPLPSAALTAAAHLAQVVMQITACTVERRGLAEMPLPPPRATRALRVPALPAGLRAVGGHLVLRPLPEAGPAGPGALEACLLLQNVMPQRLPWVRLTLRPPASDAGPAAGWVAPLRGERAFGSGEVGLLRTGGAPWPAEQERRLWRAELETARPVAQCLLQEAVMIAAPAVSAGVAGADARRGPEAMAALGWVVRLLGTPARRRTRGREIPSLFVLVLGSVPGMSVREALAAAWFGDRFWHCPLPPGATLPGGLPPALATAGDGQVSYGALQAQGDPVSLLEQLFPYLDGVFRVEPATRQIEELALYESSLRFVMKFDLLAKTPEHCLEVIEFSME